MEDAGTTNCISCGDAGCSMCKKGSDPTALTAVPLQNGGDKTALPPLKELSVDELLVRVREILGELRFRGVLDTREMQEACVRLLVEAPSNADMSTEKTENSSGDAAWAVKAAEHGNEAGLGLLLKARANVNLPRLGGATAAYVAAEQGNEACLRLILGARADPNLVDFRGVGPALIAAQRNQEACLKVLIEARADVNLATHGTGVEAFRTGDSVLLNGDAALVRRALASSGYGWLSQMEGMLGRTFAIASVPCPGSVGLPSPDQRGELLFPTTCLQKVQRGGAQQGRLQEDGADSAGDVGSDEELTTRGRERLPCSNAVMPGQRLFSPKVI